MTEDLVDVCVPGDIVTVCGVVNFINTNVDVGGGGEYACFWKEAQCYKEAVGKSHIIVSENWAIDILSLISFVL